MFLLDNCHWVPWYCPRLFVVSSPLPNVVQVCVGFFTDRGAPPQPVVPDWDNGDSAQGSDSAEEQRSAQTDAPTHRVYRGEAADQLDVHLPLRFPQGEAQWPLSSSVDQVYFISKQGMNTCFSSSLTGSVGLVCLALVSCRFSPSVQRALLLVMGII